MRDFIRRLVKSARQQRPRRTFRPSVEALEDRQLPAVFLVIDTANAGGGSLRQAILNANANPGPDTIEFDIEPPSGLTIFLTSPLPTIADQVTIDGTSQPGWISGPVIQLSGAMLTSHANGLTVTADGCQIKGLAVQNFDYDAGIALYSNNNSVTGDWLQYNFDGVDIENAVTGNVIGGATPRAHNTIISNANDGVFINEFSFGNKLLGNDIGIDVSGEVPTAFPNVNGVVLQGESSSNIIGGSAPGQANVISGNTDDGILINTGCNGNQIQGNMIGADPSGGFAIANGAGIEVYGGSNTIGGNLAGQGNRIAGNGYVGLTLYGNFNIVAGNTIGAAFVEQGNHQMFDGIDVYGSNNTIGGAAAGAGNAIGFNSNDGIDVKAGAFNAIRGNSIHDNGVAGIVLNAAASANSNQPAPTLTAAVFNPSTNVLTITGSMTGPANTKRTLDFFANRTGDDEGGLYLGSITVTIGASGKVNFSAPITVPAIGFSSAVPFITATATDPVGDTSSFSNGVHDPVAQVRRAPTVRHAPLPAPRPR